MNFEYWNNTTNYLAGRSCFVIAWSVIVLTSFFSETLTRSTFASDESKGISQAAALPTNDFRAAMEMTKRIDARIDSRLAEASVSKGPLATDTEFIRRVYLDITGANPDPSAIVDYVEDARIDKRRAMIATVVASPAVATRLSDVWTDLLVPEDAGQDFGMPARESLRRWLHSRFQENQRYDRIAGDLLIASGSPLEEPTAFFTSLELKPEKLAERTSRVFLGVALDCAQCHDHPFDSWKQKDFWSLAAYFAQLKTSTDGLNANVAMNGGALYDSDSGDVTLPDKDIVIPPRPLIAGVESGLGTGSRRQQLAIWITSKQNAMFARAATNRIWSMLMGRGLVEPIDEMGGKAVPSHPELLDELAEFFRSSDYDIRQLIMAIAASDTYASSSRGATDTDDPSLYATMLAKPLTSRQIANCLRQVARVPSPTGNATDSWQQLAAELGKIRGDASEFTGGVIQSLRTQHDSKMETLWEDSSSRLLKSLNAPFFDNASKVRWMFLATVCRPPSDGELQMLSPLIGQPKLDGKTTDWEGDLLWALLNSSEFAMTP